MYVYRSCPKMVVGILMVEHFGVHHEGHKPSPTLSGQWNEQGDSTASYR